MIRCAHADAIPVQPYGQTIAALCPDCDRDLPAEWLTCEHNTVEITAPSEPAGHLLCLLCHVEYCPTPPQVKPGQLWADANPEQAGRTVRILSITNERARCMVVTERDDIEYARARGIPMSDRRGYLIHVPITEFGRSFELLEDIPEESR